MNRFEKRIDFRFVGQVLKLCRINSGSKPHWLWSHDKRLLVPGTGAGKSISDRLIQRNLKPLAGLPHSIAQKLLYIVVQSDGSSHVAIIASKTIAVKMPPRHAADRITRSLLPIRVGFRPTNRLSWFRCCDNLYRGSGVCDPTLALFGLSVNHGCFRSFGTLRFVKPDENAVVSTGEASCTQVSDFDCTVKPTKRNCEK